MGRSDRAEIGVLPIPQERIVKKWRLQPGKMFLIDLEQGRIIDDAELKRTMSTAKPYRKWIQSSRYFVDDLPEVKAADQARGPLLKIQQAFGYSQEDFKFILEPMATQGEEATGAMGNDSPLPVLSNRAKPLFNYFKQLFAQVTNPPIDPIREEIVMSLISLVSPNPNLLGIDEKEPTPRLEVHQPVLTPASMAKLKQIDKLTKGTFRSIVVDITTPAEGGTAGMSRALYQVCTRAETAVNEGYNVVILSDRNVDAERAPIPALLACSAVHQHLVGLGLRTSCGLVVETGAAREVHHFATLAGYGAQAIHPWLAFDSIAAIAPQLPNKPAVYDAQKNFVKAINKGLMKVMSKMGISTYQSYCGAQIFEAIGLSSDLVRKYFTGTPTKVEGIGLKEVAEEALRTHADAWSADPVLADMLDCGGEYAFRVRGEEHMWTPDTIAKLQHATRSGRYDTYKEYARLINDQTRRHMTLRGLFELNPAGASVPLDEVEPAKEIVKRFATGAMSFGSISYEAHTTLAIAMNRIGGKSNTGEGGELAERFKPLANGDSMRSAIKQVASGRFGVTAEYLVNADDIQIKISQGAKPGEGGQLPGHKVDATIAKVRHSTPGVGLISPPPHHDIYSIEDLGQLIHDLKNVNPAARISVKLVSEVGVGTVAAGVAKAHADHVTIAGYDGGTGASPITSIKHAGLPWEIGLAETHQTLVLNKLRGRICVQADGGMRTGRDVVIAALLGADEMGFATAPLIVEGCIMMRKCHLNTCPVGVATQDPELRKRFTGQPEHVVNFFFFIAEEVRLLMAKLGYRRFDEMIGQTDRLDMRKAIAHWKASRIDLSRLLYKPVPGPGVAIHNSEAQDHELHKALDHRLIEQARPALDSGKPVQFEMNIRNYNRTVGAMLSGEVAKRYGHTGLPEDTIHIKLRGTAGQSFGAFLASGVTLELIGEGNDYVGKGLSGGRIAIYPPKQSPIVPEENIIVGNTVLYGAIQGECYFSGVAGERFAVRNSGAIAVVEGVGDHGCEYMTGGCVVVLGETGRNFAAGMSGGVAYVLDESGNFNQRCNLSMVELQPVPREDNMLERFEHQGGDLENHGLVDVMCDMTRHDEQRLRLLIEKHRRYTGSEKARRILENWPDYASCFLKIMPVDYRLALEKMQKAQEQAQLAH